MVPLIQQEYAKYLQLFRGNHYKGVTFLKSLLLNSDRAEEVVNSLSACTSIFADVARSNVDGMCATLLATYPEYFVTALMTYLNGNELSATPSITALLSDYAEIARLQTVPDAWDPLMFSAYFKNNLFTIKDNFDTFCVDPQKQYLAVLTDPKLLSSYAVVNSKKVSVNHGTAVQNAVLAAGYTVHGWGGVHYIEKWGQLLRAVRVTETGTGNLYPAIVRYTLATNTAEIVLVDTTLKSTSDNCSSSWCGYPAYDPDNDVVYAFYNHAGNQNNIYCAAAQLTSTTATTLFSAKIVGSKTSGSSYYQILNVSAGQGKASCCWYNNNYMQANSVTCIAYCTVLQDGTTPTTHAALVNSLGSSNFSGSNVISTCYELQDQAQGIHWYRYLYGNTCYLAAHVPLALPNGTFTLATMTRTLSAGNYTAWASIGMQYCPRKDSIAFYSTMSNDGTNYQLQYHVIHGNSVVRTAAGPTINSTIGFQGFRYDAFSDLIYIKIRNSTNTGQCYRISTNGTAKGFVAVEQTEFTQFPYTQTEGTSTNGAFANTAKYVGAQSNSSLYNIEPSLLTSL